MTDSEPDAVGEDEAQPELCDRCGAVIDDDSELYAVVRDSSVVHARDPKLDGGRMIVACSREHLRDLREQYRKLPFVDAELWSGKIYRAMDQHPAGMSEEELVHSLVYRCRELGLISDATASRTYQRLRALAGQPGFTAESVSNFPGEQPSLLGQAFDLASKETGLSVPQLAHELAWTSTRVQDLLGVQEQRPVLRLVQ
ncbi:hypothetical protein ACFXKR_40765 [Streptomyces violascens]|uniref:hypothetical protein n=1 Tax=Streptomyces violascens TaxID=67381 RepID=UPI0036C0DE81